MVRICCCLFTMRMDYLVYDVSLSFVIPWDIDLVLFSTLFLFFSFLCDIWLC